MIKFKFYITTAIDYTNSKPHLGHAYEKIIADVIARYHRVKGDDVFFLTGTDEHGQKVERAAKNAGKDTKKFVDEVVKYFKELCEKLNISYDDFIRTTDKKHIDVALKVFKKVYEKGDIYKGSYEGLYCTSCETFYLPKDLVNGLCPIHKTKPEIIKEESYFFKLGKYQKQIIDYIEKNKDFILPLERKNEVFNRLKEPLRDLSISRSSFTWGIQLPIDKKHVIYVWFDALLNYISALDYPNEKFKKYWPADLHVIGKDILWFHTVIWPAILLAADIELPKKVFVHGFINIGGEKLSKTTGITIDPIELSNKYGADSIRYFLLRAIPSGYDGDFSEEALIYRINSELADDLGNLVNRVLNLVEKNFDSKVPKFEKDELISKLALQTVKKSSDFIESFQFNNALNEIWFLVAEANKFVNDSKPWEVKDKKKLGNILYNLLETLRFLSILLYPFIPETSEKIAEQLGIGKKFNSKDLKWGLLKENSKIQKKGILFKKVNLE